MRDQSIVRATTLRPRPLSARGFIPPPSRSEIYPNVIHQQSVNEEAVVMPTRKPKVAHKTLRLKTIKQKPVDKGSLMTLGTSSIPLRASTASPASKPKAATVSRLVSQAAKRPAILGEASGNITPIAQNQISAGHKIGPENWKPITAAKFVTHNPPPKMKLHKFKRASILPETTTESLFSPPRSLPERACNDVFYDGECNSAPFHSYALSAALSPQNPAAKLMAETRLPTPPTELQRTRSALSLPNRHLEDHDRMASKSVRWDPSILADLGESSQSSEDSSEIEEKTEVGNQATNPKLDVQDCVETIKEWGRTDKSKLEKLLAALKQLEVDSEESMKEGGLSEPNIEEEEGIVITTIKSLDPRVPDFLSNVSYDTLKQQKYSQRKISAQAEVESISDKENTPLPEPKPRRNPHVGCKKSVICDDYNAHGRQVDAFEQWYAEMQLREFTKKYPLTGKKVTAVVQEQKPTLETRSSTDLSTKLGKAALSKRRNDAPLLMNDGPAGRKYVCPRREDIVATTGLSAGRHAAVIQQRLEFLLLKKRERKAMEALTLIETETEDGRLNDWL